MPLGAARTAWAVAAIAAVVAAGAIAFAVLDPFEPTPPSAATEVARETALLLLSLDAADAEQFQPRLQELAGGQFLEEVDEAFSSGLADVLQAAGSDAEAKISRVYTSELPTGSVSAIAVAEVTRSGGVLPEASTFEVHLRLDMLRVDDRWRVVEVVDLGIDTGAARRAPVSTSTAAPTTAPSGAPTASPKG